ncbi:MAG: hypothetical protein U0R64_01245 [Candidatus Nanopelagicales bacterium]
MNRVPRPWLIGNVAAAAVAVVALLVVLARNWAVNGDWVYAGGEWLISYAAGFTRRGLGGVLVAAVPGDDRTGVIVLVAALFTACCALLALLIARVMAVVGSPWPLLVWLAPGGPLLGIVQGWWQPYGLEGSSFAYRKEFLAYVILLAAALWLMGRPGRLWPGAAALSLALVVLALVHEVAALWATAAVVAMMVPLGRRAVAPAVMVLLPALMLSAWLSSRPALPGGSAQRMWEAVDPGTQTWLGDVSPEALKFMEWGPRLSRGITQRLLIDSGMWRWWLLAAALALVTAWAIAVVCDPRSPLRPAVLLLVLGVLFAGVTYLAHDAGRWISVAVMVGMIVSLTWTAQHPPEGPLRPPGWARVSALLLVAVSVVAAFPVVGTPGGLLSSSAAQLPLVALRR